MDAKTLREGVRNLRDRLHREIKAMRLAGYTVAQLCEATGYSEQRIYQILEGTGSARVGRGAHRPEENPGDRNGSTSRD